MRIPWYIPDVGPLHAIIEAHLRHGMMISVTSGGEGSLCDYDEHTLVVSLGVREVDAYWAWVVIEPDGLDYEVNFFANYRRTIEGQRSAWLDYELHRQYVVGTQPYTVTLLMNDLDSAFRDGLDRASPVPVYVRELWYNDFTE
jgi:hypothetical protein